MKAIVTAMSNLWGDGVEETDNFMSCRQLEVLLRYLDFSIIEFLFIYLFTYFNF